MPHGNDHTEASGAGLRASISRNWAAEARPAWFGAAFLTQRVLLRLAAFAPLSAEEAEAVHDLPINAQSTPPGTELVAEGAAARAGFLVSGWACRARTLPDGRRQIIGFVLPGDALAPLLRPEGELASCATVALTRVQLADAAPLRAMLGPVQAGQRCRGLQAACLAAERAEERMLLDRIVSLGRQTACERLCGLLAELHQRLAAVGLTMGNSFAMPLRQDMLADALGLSTVHVNRTLQQARRDRVAEVGGGWVNLLQPAMLRPSPSAVRAVPQAAVAAVPPVAARSGLSRATPHGLANAGEVAPT